MSYTQPKITVESDTNIFVVFELQCSLCNLKILYLYWYLLKMEILKCLQTDASMLFSASIWIHLSILIVKAFISQGEQHKCMPVQCGVRGHWTTRNIGRARTQETMAARDLTRLYK